MACRGERVVGVLQLTYLPSLTYQGGWRALIEGGTGGERRAARPDARRFYEGLGFVASHEGMKLRLG